MASMFRVSSSVLRQKAGSLRQQAEQFKSSVNQLESEESSLSGMWEGDAKAAFRNAFKNDKAQFDLFYQGILKYVEALEKAAAEYDKAEDQNVNIANSRKA